MKHATAVTLSAAAREDSHCERVGMRFTLKKNDREVSQHLHHDASLQTKRFALDKQQQKLTSDWQSHETLG